MIMLIFALSFNASAGNVKGFAKKNGTYVQPYVRISQPEVIKIKK